MQASHSSSSEPPGFARYEANRKTSRVRLEPADLKKLEEFDQMEEDLEEAHKSIDFLLMNREYCGCQEHERTLVEQVRLLRRENADLLAIVHAWVPNPSMVPCIKQEMAPIKQETAPIKIKPEISC